MEVQKNQRTETNWTSGWLDDRVVLYKQKIYNASTWRNDKKEILTRVGEENTETLIMSLPDRGKIIFDFVIIENFLKSYPQINKNHNYNINLSPSTLVYSRFFEDLMTLCEKYAFTNFKGISFELTENGFFTKPEIVILNQNIRRLKTLGIKVWLDDYPNNNNNNELLDRVNWIDFIKIDKSILLDHEHGKYWLSELLVKIWWLIDSIIKRSWKIDITIEWVENARLHDIMNDNFWGKIKYYQWFHIHRPEKLI